MGSIINWRDVNRWSACRGLCRLALSHVADAMLSIVAMALRPATARPQRTTALLLLGSLACLAMTLMGRLPSEIRLACGMCGAIGLLVSGVAGAYLDVKASPLGTTPDDL